MPAPTLTSAADGRVADVGEVVDLAVRRDLAVLDLDEVADLDVAREHGARPQARERPDLAVVAGGDAVQHGVRVHERVGAERAVA